MPTYFKHPIFDPTGLSTMPCLHISYPISLPIQATENKMIVTAV